jgi:hypothetical protein
VVGCRIGSQAYRGSASHQAHVDIEVLFVVAVPGERHLVAVRRKCRLVLEAGIGGQWLDGPVDRGVARTAGIKPPGGGCAERKTEREGCGPEPGTILWRSEPGSLGYTGFHLTLEIAEADLQIGGRLVAPRWIFAQAMLDDFLELPRHA